ncbi:S1C family serine protease [Fonticella tunisiensis]|uniref:S1-C subfamily serine protease n=1 Tax=Fonticella tunisiensis TaxID=1096341 RepID=A0A4V3ETX3_9CLOT|nr:trypsin-like peptidase domain-containing protein [Fonticella tunisiensis]TDT63255.1 S1-C subfamily serine protease [Fonticella tunisiensis]
MNSNDFKMRKPSFFGYFVSGLFGAIIGAFLILIFGPSALFTKFNQPAPSQQQTQPQQQQLVQNVGVSDISIAANKVIPSVVGIKTVEVNRSFFGNGKIQGVGSGVIVDSGGYILTNNHVAGMEKKNITVSLYDGSEVSGRTVWADPVLDLAIVKIDRSDLTPAALGDSKNVKIGEQAIAIGNPLGFAFQRTVTAGIISALNRTIEVDGNLMEDLIQTDASINPGNSGGPLINIRGEVIAINTVKATSAEGIGFAVPVNIVKPVVKSIKEKGSFTAPTIGITGYDREMAGYYDNKIIDKGIFVTSTTKGGPADVAGIREGDIILSVNDEPVNTMIGLKEALYKAGVGSTVKVRIKRPLGGETVVDVTLK